MTKKCDDCGAKCCKHIFIEIEIPEEIEDFEEIKSYVAHKNVSVFVDEDYQWFLDFSTPCEYLEGNNKCKIYETRPQVCKDFDSEDCPCA